MQVRHILRDKGRDVVAITTDATLAQAASILSERKIGALIVRDGEGALAGIISERDLVHAVADKGAAALSETVALHMTPSPATCSESDSVEVIMEIMTCGRFRHVPVLDERDQLCGMVSIGDVVKTRIAAAISEAETLRGYITATA